MIREFYMSKKIKMQKRTITGNLDKQNLHELPTNHPKMFYLGGWISVRPQPSATSSYGSSSRFGFNSDLLMCFSHLCIFWFSCIHQSPSKFLTSPSFLTFQSPVTLFLPVITVLFNSIWSRRVVAIFIYWFKLWLALYYSTPQSLVWGIMKESFMVLWMILVPVVIPSWIALVGTPSWVCASLRFIRQTHVSISDDQKINQHNQTEKRKGKKHPLQFNIFWQSSAKSPSGLCSN